MTKEAVNKSEKNMYRYGLQERLCSLYDQSRQVITIYRTEAACFKDFDFFGFFAELTHQLKCSIDEIFCA